MSAKGVRAPAEPPAGLELLSVEHAAWLLGCSVATVYREIADGRLAHRRVRRLLRVHRDDVRAYLEGPAPAAGRRRMPPRRRPGPGVSGSASRGSGAARTTGASRGRGEARGDQGLSPPGRSATSRSRSSEWCR